MIRPSPACDPSSFDGGRAYALRQSGVKTGSAVSWERGEPERGWALVAVAFVGLLLITVAGGLAKLAGWL